MQPFPVNALFSLGPVLIKETIRTVIQTVKKNKKSQKIAIAKMKDVAAKEAETLLFLLASITLNQRRLR